MRDILFAPRLRLRCIFVCEPVYTTSPNAQSVFFMCEPCAAAASMQCR
jgi:hypothetical protein